MRRSSLVAAGAVLASLLLTACAPSCDRTCRKLSKCAEDGSTVTRIECEDECVGLIQEYDELDDEVREELFASHRRCVVGATCEELDDGVCYDETLYAF